MSRSKILDCDDRNYKRDQHSGRYFGRWPVSSAIESGNGDCIMSTPRSEDIKLGGGWPT